MNPKYLIYIGAALLLVVSTNALKIKSSKNLAQLKQDTDVDTDSDDS